MPAYTLDKVNLSSYNEETLKGFEQVSNKNSLFYTQHGIFTVKMVNYTELMLYIMMFKDMHIGTLKLLSIIAQNNLYQFHLRFQMIIMSKE